jgi:hypothetical protein
MHVPQLVDSPRPCGRDVVDAGDARAIACRQYAALRLRRCRVARLARTLEAVEIARSSGSDSREEWIERRLVGNIMRRLERFVNAKLKLCVGSRTRTIVMENLLGFACIRPHLPNYYPPLAEARAQQRIIQNLKGSLDLVKGMQ